MLSKVKISGKVVLESGLHIGGSDAFAAIGAIDSPVIKDPLTNLPIIPGSSLKGKMRALLAKAYNQKLARTPDEDDAKITRLFGSNGNDETDHQPVPARLIFRDAALVNDDELLEKGVENITETKFENTIDRITTIANPRQIERAIRGSEFELELIYDVVDESEMLEDFQTITDGFKLLELDYLGGSGSRGYGKVRFQALKFETVFGNADVTPLAEMMGVD